MGIIVRAPTIGQGSAAGVQSILGGQISAFTQMCETTRREAFEKMVANAERLGADAVIAMRFDATEFAANSTEVLAYGTAVRLNADSTLNDDNAVTFLDGGSPSQRS